MRECVWTHRVIHESESLLCWKQTVGWELHQGHGARHKAEPHKQPNRAQHIGIHSRKGELWPPTSENTLTKDSKFPCQNQEVKINKYSN